MSISAYQTTKGEGGIFGGGGVKVLLYCFEKDSARFDNWIYTFTENFDVGKAHHNRFTPTSTFHRG